jgi:hypothetical protein
VTPRPLENSPELVDQVANELRKLGEGWHNRPTRKGFRFTESYLNLGMNFHLVYEVGRGAHEYIAVCKRKSFFGNEANPHLGEIVREAVHSSQPTGPVHAHALIGGEDSNDHPVFIHDIEVVQNSESFVVPSDIRLYVKAQFDEVTRRALYFSQYTSFVLRGGRNGVFVAAPDRESRVIGHIGHDGASEIVERGSQRMDDVATAKGDFAYYLGSSRFVDLQAQVDVVSSLRIRLHDDFVGLQFPEGGIPGFELRDLLIGPFDTSVNVSEVDGHAEKLYAATSEDAS